MRFEFVENHGEFALAWLSEYYGSRRWGAVRVLAGPGLALLGYQLGALRPGEWIALIGTLIFGYGVYYACRPLLQVTLLVRKRAKLGASRRTTVMVIDDGGVRIHSGKAEMKLGWEKISAAGWRPRYFWVELNGGARAVIPTRAISNDDRGALEQLFRERDKWQR